jgi:putative membrane protein
VACAEESISSEDFVRKASIANEFEIESSKLALDRSQSKDIKLFARRVIDDHTKTGKDLKDVLRSSHAKMQAEEKLDDEHQKLLDKLEATSGDDFNSQYVSLQTDAHKKAIALFSDYSKHGEDAVLKEFATDTLPTLEDHLEHAEKLDTGH